MGIWGTIIGIICVLSLIANVELIRLIDEKEREDKKFYANLRRNYEIEVEELKKDIELYEELFEAYQHKGEN